MLQLGAINNITKCYIYPKIANKTDQYSCIDCKSKVILCKGDIVKPYFRHYKLNECMRYENPNESQIHKDAKLLLKQLFDDGKNITINSKCNCCNNQENTIINTINKNIVLEYRFDYNGLKIADVAYLNDNKVKYIIEIFNTHKTKTNSRPDPWFELDALELITNVNMTDDYQFICKRIKYCDKCIEDSKSECKRCKNTFSELISRNIYNVCSNCNDLLFDRIYLNVPYSQKDLIKSYGGMFDKQCKKWYISKTTHIDSIFYLWKRIKFVTLENNDKIYLDIPINTQTKAKFYGVLFDSTYKKWFITKENHLKTILSIWNEIKYESFYDTKDNLKYNKNIVKQMKQLFID